MRQRKDATPPDVIDLIRYLLALGWTHAEVALDPRVNLHPRSVTRLVARYSIPCRNRSERMRETMLQRWADPVFSERWRNPFTAAKLKEARAKGIAAIRARLIARGVAPEPLRAIALCRAKEEAISDAASAGNLPNIELQYGFRVRGIQELCAKAYQISVAELLGKRRNMEIIAPRFAAIYICAKLFGLSTTVLGRLFGNRDHTTIINALNKVKWRIEHEPAYADLISALVSQAEAILSQTPAAAS